MRVRHGLAPIGHHEVTIDFLGLAEALRGHWILEVVQQRESAKECRLRGGSAAVRKRDFPESVLRGNRQRDEKREDNNDERAIHLAIIIGVLTRRVAAAWPPHSGCAIS